MTKKRYARSGAGRLLAAAVAAAMLAACSGGGGGGTGSTAAVANGSLRLAMTDAPGCGFDHVNVTVEKVRVHQSATAQDTDAGWVDLTLAPARRMDLLALTNGALEELGTMALPAGHYSQARLVLAANPAGGTPANSVQPSGAAEVALATPDAQGAGVKLLANFDVAAGQTADMVLDFDACTSVVKAGTSGQYILKPVVSVLPRIASAITGVAAGLAPASTTIAAQREGITVRATRPDAGGNFSIPFLPQGTYTLVITSEGRATGVVTNVPVGAGKTVVGTSAAPISLPASVMANMTGSVSETLADTAVTGAMTDVAVRATQSLTGGPEIGVGLQIVDAQLGSYRLRVPNAAPLRATYAASGALAFTPDSAAAGAYKVDLLVTDLQ